MKSLPRFPPLPTVGHVPQTNPLVWLPAHHGFPCWFKKPTQTVKPFYSARALAQASALNLSLPERVDLGKATIVELRARQNPWHPSGRVDRIVFEFRAPGVTICVRLTLKFNGDGEQIECVDVLRADLVFDSAVTKVVTGKYTGPRGKGDTIVSGNTRKRP